MIKQSLIKKTYLNECDYISKYNLKSTYTIPRVDSIVLRINCNNCIINETSDIKYVYYYILYVYFLHSPKIIYSLKNNTPNYKNDTGTPQAATQYSFLITLSDSEEINNYVTTLIKICGCFTKKNGVSKKAELSKTYTFSYLKINKNLFSLSINAQLCSFPDLKDAFLLLKKDINVNNIIIESKIKFKGGIYTRNSTDSFNLIKNLPVFG